uniref:Uncharacterized protein n=1 Tax=Hordeum vulgare subsp. vulgare TaxID=112509 RepID=A0A8I6X7U3_HORVV
MSTTLYLSVSVSGPMVLYLLSFLSYDKHIVHWHFYISRMAKDMLAIYLHYEDVNRETKILQRSMMRRDVSYDDLILMIEEVGFQTIDFLYYTKKTRLGNPYFIHIYDQHHVMKMLSDPDIVKKVVHMYVSKEKAGDDIAPPSKQFDISPSNHPNESVVFQDSGVCAEREGKLGMERKQRPLRRSKRLNVIQVTDQHDDEDGDCNNGEQFAPGHESQALEDGEGEVENQVQKEIRKHKKTSLPVVWNMPKGQRIVVKCNKNSQPIGDEGAILGKFLGTIARNGGFFPLNINYWHDVKKNSGVETILQCVQTKYVYPRSCEKWILKSIARDWRKYKSSLKDAFFKSAIEKNLNIKRKALYKLYLEDVTTINGVGFFNFGSRKKEGPLLRRI